MAIDPQRRHIIEEKFLPLDGGNDLCGSRWEFRIAMTYGMTHDT